MKIILKLLQVIRMFGLSTALTTKGKLNTVKRFRSAEILSGSLSSERSRRANVSTPIFLFPKCARTDHKLFLSRIELISFHSSF